MDLEFYYRDFKSIHRTVQEIGEFFNNHGAYCKTMYWYLVLVSSIGI